MKNQFTLLFLLFTIFTYSQSFNTEDFSEESNPKLLGKINKDKLTTKSYSEWFVKNHEEYQSNSETINQLKENISDYTITLFMGTWCGDSKKEVPRFYKILEEANFPIDQLTTVAVDRVRENYKQSPGGEQEGMNIHRVPTFIIYKDGKEINRIVEHPVKSLEDDILNIINNNYKSNYQIVEKTDSLLKEMGIEKFDKKRNKVIKKIKPLAVNFFELNTYSSVLFYSNKTKEGIAIARINISLYPNEDRGYVNLANKLYRTGKSKEALSFYNKALVINPSNKSAKKSIQDINSKEDLKR